ncbi:hypothetical protein WMY93_013350 [Mugilogobius chulae]|uniref:Zinc finger AN1-type containing 3 n=1 Tax=Mugilogobius chulae TaxID=88201 RepID=A0AAW0P5T6_9GOBI
MGDTGSEGRKPSANVNIVPPRCPCGFWGSSKTMNLCSKCFADSQKKDPDEDAVKKSPNSSYSQPDIFSNNANNNFLQHLPQQSAHQWTLRLRPLPKMKYPAEAPMIVHFALPQNALWNQPLTSSSPSSRSGPKQRNRKRCHHCQTKLELVQQELGSCRCGNVFCMLHRLPEQHECIFDHLGRGRQEAVLKMVKLDRKVGRSCQRIGEECS